MTASTLAQKGPKTLVEKDPKADTDPLPGTLYGTRDAIFHLLRDEQEQDAPAPNAPPNIPPEDAIEPVSSPGFDQTPAQAASAFVERGAPRAVTASTPIKVARARRRAANSDASLPIATETAPDTAPEKTETNKTDIAPETVAVSDSPQRPNKARFREKQQVAKGTSARFTPKAARAPLVLPEAKRAKPVKAPAKSVEKTGSQTPLSSAAMEVLRGHLRIVANTDSPASDHAPDKAPSQRAQAETATPAQVVERTRTPLPLPRPVASVETLDQLFNEDHFEFQSTSPAAALREKIEQRRMMRTAS